MALQKLQFKPGVNRDLTSYTTEGGWYDSDLVRFRLGFPQSIGGWQRYSSNKFLGTCRSLFGWSTLLGSYYNGVGTSLKFYVENGGAFYDITPIRKTITLSNPFTATTGSKTITVHDVGHGAYNGDFVTYSGATSLGGNITAAILNTEYQITRIDDDNYTITASVAASSSDTLHGGVAVVTNYQINTGINTSVVGNGWGTGTWGRLGWGSGTPVTVTNSLRLWSQDSFGEDLIFNVRNGDIYYWKSSTSTLPGNVLRAVSLSSLSTDTTTPTRAIQVMVSDQSRHIIAFGANEGGITPADQMLIRFSDQEDYTVWYPTATNTAGDLRLGIGSTIIRAIETKREILVWTDIALYSMQFIGPPYTFGVQPISLSTTTMGYNAFVSVEDTVYWMGMNKFYVYNGATDELPCSVKKYVFDNFNFNQNDKVYACTNSEFNEVTWFYPTADSDEVNRYVTYNYADKAWTYGSMARTAWVDRGVNDYPLAASVDGYLYNQELGLNDGSNNPPTALNTYIESSVFDLDSGDHFMFVHRMIPDVSFFNSTVSSDNQNPSVLLTMKTQNFPGGVILDANSADVTRTAKNLTVPVDRYTDQVFIRLRGRQMVFRIESDKTNTCWGLGTPRFDMRPDGRR